MILGVAWQSGVGAYSMVHKHESRAAELGCACSSYWVLDALFPLQVLCSGDKTGNLKPTVAGKGYLISVVAVMSRARPWRQNVGHGMCLCGWQNELGQL